MLSELQLKIDYFDNLIFVGLNAKAMYLVNVGKGLFRKVNRHVFFNQLIRFLTCSYLLYTT